jgi:oxygen-independent coproporphyrinogen-3 oxidase
MVRHLYIHVPYCHRICPYCSFYKHTPGGTDHAAFVRSLLAELDHHLSGSTIAPHTIYLGGGTPTALSRTHLGQLLTGLGERLDLAELEEWDIEANPATFGPAKAALMRDAGVTRISLGVQSWTPSTLETLGRDHSPAQAAGAFEVLKAEAFPSLNIDLMFSVPGQTEATWREDLQRTLALEPDHVSAYNLNYEEDTEFFDRHQAGELDSDPDRDASLFQASIDLLAAAGFEHYEISNHARPGHRSRHNAAYWAGADYIGIGPGAFSTASGERWRNLPDTAGYIRAISEGAFRKLVTEHETIDDDAFRKERIALGLRTTDGVARRYLSGAEQTITPLLANGLVEWANDHLTLTAAGKGLADPIAAELF